MTGMKLGPLFIQKPADNDTTLYISMSHVYCVRTFRNVGWCLPLGCSFWEPLWPDGDTPLQSWGLFSTRNHQWYRSNQQMDSAHQRTPNDLYNCTKENTIPFLFIRYIVLIGHSTYLGHRSVLKWEPSSWGSEQRWQQQSKCHLRFKWFRRAKVWDRGRTYWLQISSPASIDLQDCNCSLKWFPFYLFIFWRLRRS